MREIAKRKKSVTTCPGLHYCPFKHSIMWLTILIKNEILLLVLYRLIVADQKSLEKNFRHMISKRFGTPGLEPFNDIENETVETFKNNFLSSVQLTN